MLCDGTVSAAVWTVHLQDATIDFCVHEYFSGRSDRDCH